MKIFVFEVCFMKKRPMNRKMLEYYARMAADAYMNDPVHARATKNEKADFRFDIIEVILHDLYTADINHIKNAF